MLYIDDVKNDVNITPKLFVGVINKGAKNVKEPEDDDEIEPFNKQGENNVPQCSAIFCNVLQ